MPQWGRAATAADMTGSSRPSYSRRSFWIGLIALAISSAALVGWISVSKDASGATQDATTLVFIVCFLGIAPLLNTIGFIFALIGLFRDGDSKPLAVLGLFLNVGAVAVGAGFVWVLLSAAAAFT